MSRKTAPFTLEPETTALGWAGHREALNLMRQRLDPDVFALHTDSASEGPARQHSTLLAVPVLRIRLADREVHLSGSPAVVEEFYTLLHSSGIAGPGQGPITLARRSDIWHVLRLASDLFGHDAGPSRFDIGFAGYLGYDVGRCIEELPVHLTRPPGQVDLDLAIHAVRVDVGADGLASLTINHVAGADGPRMNQVLPLLTTEEARPVRALKEEDPITSPVRFSVEPSEFEARARCAQRYIRDGDIYQVQLGHSLEITSSGDPIDVFEDLRSAGSCPYTFFFRAGPHTVVGASPEAFVRVTDGVVEMVPIAGTRRCAGDHEAAEVGDALSPDPPIEFWLMIRADCDLGIYAAGC